MAEKFPFLFQPRKFLLGLVEIPAWGYWYGYSNAYIELMCMDGVVHDFRDKEMRGNPNNPTKESIERTRIAYEKMKAEREAKRKETPIEAQIQNNE